MTNYKREMNKFYCFDATVKISDLLKMLGTTKKQISSMKLTDSERTNLLRYNRNDCGCWEISNEVYYAIVDKRTTEEISFEVRVVNPSPDFVLPELLEQALGKKFVNEDIPSNIGIYATPIKYISFYNKQSDELTYTRGKFQDYLKKEYPIVEGVIDYEKVVGEEDTKHIFYLNIPLEIYRSFSYSGYDVNNKRITYGWTGEYEIDSQGIIDQLAEEGLNEAITYDLSYDGFMQITDGVYREFLCAFLKLPYMPCKVTFTETSNPYIVGRSQFNEWLLNEIQPYLAPQIILMNNMSNMVSNSNADEFTV